MTIALLLKVLHVLIAMGFISGLIGRFIVLTQAAASDDIKVTALLVGLAGRFEKYLVIPGSTAVLVAGLLTAWAQGWAILGFITGGHYNWLLVSLLLFLSNIPIIIYVFVPKGKIFEGHLNEALAKGSVTPELKSAFDDRVVAAGHRYELISIALIVILMVLKPF